MLSHAQACPAATAPSSPPSHLASPPAEVKACLEHIAGSPLLALEDRQAFLRELRHAYGRTGEGLDG